MSGKYQSRIPQQGPAGDENWHILWNHHNLLFLSSIFHTHTL
jgi:hypothetical protein